VPGVASLQDRAPARREGGREFQALGPGAQKDWLPTVFNFSVRIAKERNSDNIKERTGV